MTRDDRRVRDQPRGGTAGLGVLIILLGVAANEWILALLLSADGSLDAATKVGIWSVDLLLIATGGLLVLLRNKISLRTIGVNAVVFVVLLGVVEVALIGGRKGLIPAAGPFLEIFQKLYYTERRIVQYLPECARFDERLGYTLRPGGCVFANAEFSHRLDVNSRGWRDDEASLEAPEVIFLGDSITMGWGVSQQETMAQIVEQRTGLTSLNAAISSYGTAREILSLDGLETRQLKLLAIQYCSNDFEENQKFLLGGNALETMTAERYAGGVEAHRSHRYVFGSHLYWLIKSRVYSVLFHVTDLFFPGYLAERQKTSVVDPRAEADAFLNVLRASPVDLSSTRILVFELNEHANNDRRFLDALAQELPAAEAGGLPLDVELIDFSTLLDRRHFYPLDGHLNAEGHRLVAETLLDRMAP